MRYLDCSIREANSSDLNTVCKIDQDAFSLYGTSESCEIIKARQEVFSDGFFVAEITGEVVGYCSCEKWLEMRQPAIGELPSQTHSEKGRILCITAMAVKRDYQRVGIGKQLLRRVLQVADDHECKQILLETSNAKTFYVPFGFNVINEIKHNQTTLYVMLRQI